MIGTEEIFTLKEASEWATKHINKIVTPANISYLVQYGRIKKIDNNTTARVSKQALINYYESYNGLKENLWKNQLGEDLNWALSFDQYKEAETTKHVHRLHPYKGKFIPQLVEYFLDEHRDSFKTKNYFEKNDIVLDPFSGSGTTMVQAAELVINAIGIDISVFNSFIGNCKVEKYDLLDISNETQQITRLLKNFLTNSPVLAFEEKLLEALAIFNNQYFPPTTYKYQLRQGNIEEAKYGAEKEQNFLSQYNNLVKEYGIKLQQEKSDNFLDKWYTPHIRSEIDLVFKAVKNIKNLNTKRIISLILSRTLRSCRATTHADLATLVEPMVTTYYCSKHGKICKPLFSILKWWETYAKDTLKRLAKFDELRTPTFQICLAGDSRTMDIFSELKKENPAFGALAEKQKIKGIFSSPPYVGLIDYHEQHAYAYDLFGFERKDDLEIGAMHKGKGKMAQKNYVKGISDVLINCKKYLAEEYDVFLVANDKNNLYPKIAENAGMIIVNQFKRPVLNRTEKDKGAYSEIIFHLKNRKDRA